MDANTADTPSNSKDMPNDTLLTLNSDGNDTPMVADKKKPTIDLTDSDNDSDDQGGLTGVDNLNISARVTRLMRGTTLTNALDNDDDSDDDDPLKDNVLFRTPAAVKTPAVKSLLQTDPSPRPDKSNSDNSSSDNEEDDMTQQHKRLPAAVASPTENRQKCPFNFFAGASESSSSSSEDEQQKRQRQPKQTRQKKTLSTATTISDDNNDDGKKK